MTPNVIKRGVDGKELRQYQSLVETRHYRVAAVTDAFSWLSSSRGGLKTTP